jgi:hypothetical protein
VETFGTGKIDEDRIAALVREHFDLRPLQPDPMLDLIKPIYRKTAAYGHFGRELPEFSGSAPTRRGSCGGRQGSEGFLSWTRTLALRRWSILFHRCIAIDPPILNHE